LTRKDEMQYRRLGKTGKDVSVLGFGCMRLPEEDKVAVSLIRRAVELGVNYFETAITYCKGRGEVQVGLGLRGLRDDVYVSTKSQVRPGTTGEDTGRNLEESLGKLGTDRVDFYQLHGFKLENLPVAQAEGGPLDVLREARDRGVVGHIGFTSHDTPENIIRIMETGEFESVTVYNNILKTRGNPDPAIRWAHEHGIGVVIMGSLGGGVLASPSPQLRALLPKTSKSTVELAFRYLLSNPGITTCLSGMTRMSDVEENARVAGNAQPLTAEEVGDIQEVLDHYRELGDRYCTGCGYCTPCPNGVAIPEIFRLVNYYKVYGIGDWARDRYRRIARRQGQGADRCQECGECEEKCPNDIPVREQMKEARTLLE